MIDARLLASDRPAIAAPLIACYMTMSGVTTPMPSKISRHAMQPPAKPVGQKVGESRKTAGAAQVPAVARRGELTLQQVKHAVDTALRGQTFEADAQG